MSLSGRKTTCQFGPAKSRSGSLASRLDSARRPGLHRYGAGDSTIRFPLIGTRHSPRCGRKKQTVSGMRTSSATSAASPAT